jgi:hypothetical protein
MKNSILVLVVLIVLLACDHLPTTQKTEVSIISGIYYNYSTHSDTLVLQSKGRKTRLARWSEGSWRITKDSVFQKDSRGLSWYLGKDKCRYRLKSDTLILTFQLRSMEVAFEKYQVLKSNKDSIELVRLISKEETEIRSDIQLR